MAEWIMLSHNIKWSGDWGVVSDLKTYLWSSGDKRRATWFDEGEYVGVPGEVWNFASLEDVGELQCLVTAVQGLVADYERQMGTDGYDARLPMYREHALKLLDALRRRIEELGAQRR